MPHSFPPRRSSDLATEAVILIARQAVGKVAVVQVVLRLVLSLEGLLLGLRAVAQVVDAGSASVGPRATEVGDRHLGGGAGVVGVAGPGGGAEDDGAVPRSRLLDRLRLVVDALRHRGWRSRCLCGHAAGHRSEEHTSELQSLMRISYA